MDLFKECLGEFVGTLILVLLGNGVCFSVNHSKMFANQPGKWIVIVLGWALAVFFGAISATFIGSAGHLNPAVSVYAAFSDSGRSLVYIPVQFLGAMMAQIVLYTINWNFIKDEINSKEEEKVLTRASSCTNPAYQKAYWSNFLYEFIGTLILLLAILIATSKALGTNSTTITIAIISASVMAIGFSLGSATGFAINPARDLGPRIVYQVLLIMSIGKKLARANWEYAWIPVVAPLSAGLIFGLISLA